ncbi:hypothetical protein CBL_03167 [Carabus blaptoides fortunei]
MAGPMNDVTERRSEAKKRSVHHHFIGSPLLRKTLYVYVRACTATTYGPLANNRTLRTWDVRIHPRRLAALRVVEVVTLRFPCCEAPGGLPSPVCDNLTRYSLLFPATILPPTPTHPPQSGYVYRLVSSGSRAEGDADTIRSQIRV